MVWVDSSTTPKWAFLLALAAFAISVYRSLGRFHRRLPPFVPYLVPWVGSALSMGKDPDGFFARAMKTLGPVFRVKAAGRESIYVASPSLINAIYKDPKFTQDVFGIPHEISFSKEILSEYFPSHTRVLSPKGIVPILNRYVSYAHEELNATLGSRWDTTVALKEVLLIPAYNAAARTFLGPSFPAEKTYQDFNTFNDAFHIITAGVPRFLLPGPFRAWDRVISHVKDHVSKLRERNEEVTELVAMTLDECERHRWIGDNPSVMLAADLWALEANAIWAVYWTIVYLLRSPHGIAPVVAEIDQARENWTSTHSSTPLTGSTFPQFLEDSMGDLPLLTSSIHEILRLTTSSFSIRRVSSQTEFAGFEFKEGDEIICTTRAVHVDEEIYEDPYQFKMDRFLDGQNKFQKDGKPVPNHLMPFGGGVSMCEGRHFALNEMKSFITILLTYATFELSPDNSCQPELQMDRIGVGIMGSKGDLNVVIKRRIAFA